MSQPAVLNQAFNVIMKQIAFNAARSIMPGAFIFTRRIAINTTSNQETQTTGNRKALNSRPGKRQ